MWTRCWSANLTGDAVLRVERVDLDVVGVRHDEGEKRPALAVGAEGRRAGGRRGRRRVAEVELAALQRGRGRLDEDLESGLRRQSGDRDGLGLARGDEAVGDHPGLQEDELHPVSFAERPFGVVPLASAAAGTSAHASAASNARAARFPLPSDTGGLSQDVAGSARRPAPQYMHTAIAQFAADSKPIPAQIAKSAVW